MSSLDSEFEALLNYIKRNRGFDFTGYKRSTLMRRVRKRMQAVEIDSYTNYIDYLEVHPQEFADLFNTILINVTSFFRDSLVWDYLSAEIIPQIVAREEPHEQIRIWSAGCASGQEAYTLAIILAEAMGIEQFQTRVKIYATDVDEEALNQARQATYNPKEIACLTPEIVEKYFDRIDTLYTFRKDLRRFVIFGRHDLVQDAPISRVDLLVCRNTLMYFNAESQAKIVNRFHFALQDDGFLFVGKAEMLLSNNNSFATVDLKRRVFSKLPKVNTRDRVLLLAQNNGNREEQSVYRPLRDIAFDIIPVAQLVIDANGKLILANERAQMLFNLTSHDLGQPFHNLGLSYRPIDLRACIDQVYIERRMIYHRDVEWSNAAGDSQYFDVQISPLLDITTNLLGISMTFTDVTRSRKLQDELEHSTQELEMAYEELQSANEELETTNEELQSSNEELETTNEELQSTNEELETMNEELHSSNEELQTINELLRLRSEEFNAVNAFLGAILTSLLSAVIVLDNDFLVQVWSDRAGDLWGLRATEVQGQHFLSLDIGLPVEQLRQPIRACLAGESSHSEIILAAINRRGKTIHCEVTCVPLMYTAQEIRGVIILMTEKTNDLES